MYTEQPQLTSLDGPGVYPLQVIYFKCSVESSILSWRCNEYLNCDGGDHELALTSEHSQGEQIVGECSGVVAVLDSIDGSTKHSTLRIVVSAVHPKFTVSCRNQDSGRNSNMTFYLIGEFSIIIEAM